MHSAQRAEMRVETAPADLGRSSGSRASHRVLAGVLQGLHIADGSTTSQNVLGIRWGWLIILAFLVQAVTIPIITDPSALGTKKVLLATTSLMLALGILPNLRWWAFRIVGVGFLLNTLVIVSNGGLMPVTPENHAKASRNAVAAVAAGQTPPGSKDVVLTSSGTRLRFLSDILYFSSPQQNVYSIGDLVLLLGLAAFLVEGPFKAIALRRQQRRNQPPRHRQWPT